MKLLNTVSLSAFSFLFISCQSLTSGQLLPGGTSAASTEKKKSRYERVKDVSKESLFTVPYRILDNSKSIVTIGFGSCNDQNLPQPLWKFIAERKPDLFLMMGDNVYASRKEDRPIIDQYIKLNQNEDYVRAREAIPFLATWDDHDYGQQDGGADNPEKSEARRLFLNYWTYLKQTLPKDQSALYHGRILGPKKKTVQIIMLDTRSDRSPLTKNPAHDAATPDGAMYLPNNDVGARLLSDAQWAWLETELRKSSELKIIVSSIQFVAESPGYEKWGNFPLERQRLLKLIEKLKLKNVVILSGDRHLASVAKIKNGKSDLYDITSSSLNKARSTFKTPAVPEQDPNYTSPSYSKINFGMAEINWNKREVTFEIIDEANKPQLSQSIRF